MAEPTRTMLASERDLLYRWWQAYQNLSAAKSLEAQLRSELVGSTRSGQIEEGRESIYVGDSDWKLVIDHKMNYAFDYSKLPAQANDMLAQVQHELNNLLNVDCVIVKFEFDATAYKKANENIRLSLAPLVTAKPGTPQVKLVEPPKKDAL